MLTEKLKEIIDISVFPKRMQNGTEKREIHYAGCLGHHVIKMVIIIKIISRGTRYIERTI